MFSPSITLPLPAWVSEFISAQSDVYPTIEDRMHLAIELSRLNSENNTGGPFGAAIFEQENGQIVAAGVNIVVRSRCSLAHAEMVAIALAQQKLGYYDLGGPSMPAHDLVTSTEPCTMCFGATLWSGVKRIVCGARSQDACAIGYDEGPKPRNWVLALETRGISVIRDVCREKAREVLNSYAMHGGSIYNARQV